MSLWKVREIGAMDAIEEGTGDQTLIKVVGLE